MEGRLTCVLRTVVFLLGCWRLSAFNLDTDNVNEMKGPADSLFGFSIALHWQVFPHDSRILLVGAPRADGWSGQTAKVTGGLYSCDMTAGATCIRVQFDEKDDPKKESKENQWMGVSVNSQGPGGKILTCAHRYQRRNGVGTSIESRDIIGRCYVLSQTLSIDTSDQEEGGSWHFCDNRPRGHEMFGSCQQGVSATFDDDYHYLIFGAPGAYNWKGVVRLEQKNNTFVDNFIFDDGPFELGDENEKNPDLVPAPPNSYLGFSLDSGKRVTSKDELTVVAGAPRANHSGAVVLLKKGQERNLLEEYTLEGEGLASSFGYDLAVLDLNNDGWKDIVVGAPQYFEKDGEIGGAVYVYVNKAGKWNKVKPTRIDGPQDSMFGLAVENLGDINLDDFNDFAVGAPFDNDGAGNVYIYHGAANGLSSKEAAQVLSGKPGVKQFGYSLAGNIDLDKNSYPDLAVGSLSDSVFVYRARPVINIVKEIVFTPKEIDLTKKNCDNNNNFCLEVKVCLSYTASPQSYAPRLTVAYTLEVDAERVKNRINPRATIYGTNSHRYIGIVSMDRKGEKTCFKRSLVIQENIKDKLHGIPVNVSVDIKGANRKRRQSFASQMTPVLDAKAPATTQSEVQFLKVGCGEDNVCRSKLMVECRYGHRSSDKEFTPLDREGDMQVTSLSDQRDIALEVKVSNLDGDDAHEANVIATFPRYLTYSAYHQADTTADKVSCTANKDGSQVGCDLGNPFKHGSMKTFYITLGTSGISANITELEVDLQLNTTSNQGNIAPYKAKAKVNIVLQLPLSGQAVPSQVYFTGEAKDEDAIKTESAIGSAITHQFRIINLGKSLKDFGDVALHITWPKETTEGKRLLYLMKISSTGVDQIDCSPKGEINPRGIEPSNTRERRAAGKSQGTGEGTLSRLLDKKKYKTLSCDNNGGATCVTIKCPLRGMDSNAVFTLNSRLWNATFIEEYSKLHHVEVIVKASLHIDSTTTVLENAETQVMLTVFPERNEARYTGGSPWWIILLSILFALLLLALLAFLLWKCGFFKRAKYEDKVPSYNAVRIKREERAVNPGNGNWENLEKKPWMTTWHDKEHYS